MHNPELPNIQTVLLPTVYVYGLPFQPHADLTPVHQNDSRPC